MLYGVLVEGKLDFVCPADYLKWFLQRLSSQILPRANADLQSIHEIMETCYERKRGQSNYKYRRCSIKHNFQNRTPCNLTFQSSVLETSLITGQQERGIVGLDQRRNWSTAVMDDFCRKTQFSVKCWKIFSKDGMGPCQSYFPTYSRYRRAIYATRSRSGWQSDTKKSLWLFYFGDFDSGHELGEMKREHRTDRRRCSHCSASQSASSKFQDA